MENRTPDTIETRKIAMLIDDGFDDDHVSTLKSALEDEGARVKIVSKLLGEKSGTDGETVDPDKHHVAAASVSFDAVLIPGGSESVDAMRQQGSPKHFVAEAFKHYKPIAAVGEGTDLLEAVDLPETDIADDGDLVSDTGVVTCRNDDLEEFAEAFRDAIAQHRHWEREPEEVPA